MRVGILAGAAMALTMPSSARAEEGITAVFSRVSDDYGRAVLPDGSFRSEAYAFGEGGYQGGAIFDETIDQLRFSDVARVIAGPLASQNYVPSRDPSATRLLIMVYWGATDGSMDFASLNVAGNGGHGRGRGNGGFGSGGYGGGYGGGYDAWNQASMRVAMTDMRNAGILGYGDSLNERGLGAIRERIDLLNEIQYSRYFVVLMAYDFQPMWRHKQHKLLWETRFSVREQGNDFTVALPAMAQYASEYFGRDSHGLLRKHVPDGRIYMGDPTLIEYLSGPKY